MSSKNIFSDQLIHYSVDEAAGRLKQMYIMERELFRILGGYLPNIEDWQLKKLIPLHIWALVQRNLHPQYIVFF